MYYGYILLNERKTRTYTGVYNNALKRLKEHIAASGCQDLSSHTSVSVAGNFHKFFHSPEIKINTFMFFVQCL